MNMRRLFTLFSMKFIDQDTTGNVCDGKCRSFTRSISLCSSSNKPEPKEKDRFFFLPGLLSAPCTALLLLFVVHRRIEGLRSVT